MLKQILEFFYNSKSFTLKKLSRDLNISEDRLVELIDQLIRMDYLKEDTEKKTCTESNSCTSCPFSKGCNIEFMKFYSLTDRGVKYINK